MVTWQVLLVAAVFLLADARSSKSRRQADRKDPSDQLVYSAILFRHGDRPPSIPYPNDKNNNNPMYARGAGQLLSQGEKRHYILGKYFADRYIGGGLLNPQYTPSEFYARTLDMDRVMMSGLSNLAGLWKPTTAYDTWDENFLWQAIPLHTVPMASDSLLSPKFPCPKYDAKYLEILGSDSALAVTQEYQDLLDKANANSGKTYDWNTFYIISDAIWTDRFFGLPNPDWLTEEETDRLANFYIHQLDWWFADASIRKFRIGMVLGQVSLAFKYAAAGKSVFPAGLGTKMTYYSGQAETVAPLLYTFGIFNNMWPIFASAVMMELRKDSSGKLNVQIYYKNETRVDGDDVPAMFMDMPGCPYPCSLDDFQALIRDSIITNLADSCAIPLFKREKKVGRREEEASVEDALETFDF